MYDERGRPVNPESKRINRDIIRSHNEVMLVIGVAEPENGLSESQAETARRHHQYEDDTGHTLLRVSRLVEAAGAWGVTGARHRILVCNSPSNKVQPSSSSHITAIQALCPRSVLSTSSVRKEPAVAGYPPVCRVSFVPDEELP